MWDWRNKDFNPHHPQGGDWFILNELLSILISIHTTRKVVTRRVKLCNITKKYFNPHHPQGGDYCTITINDGVLDFNPHHPQGGDLLCPPETQHLLRFQSTPPARWWPFSRAAILWSKPISIHTTRKVVTQMPMRRYSRLRISIHTTRKVVTTSSATTKEFFIFQSTPPARWWLTFRFVIDWAIEFQSTPPARWWPKAAEEYPPEVNFNPHHPQGGDSNFSAS